MFAIIILLLIIAIYYYTTRNHDYWAKRNVKHEAPVPLFGTNFRNQTGKISITEITSELYKKYKGENFVGRFKGTTPELIVFDLEVVRQILTVDFAAFYNRGLGRKSEFLLTNVFHADGDQWRLLRQRLTPAFTTAKLKNMFPLIIKCAEKLQVVGENIVKNSGEFDVREFMARFTTEFIGACGFGIEMDTINNEHSLFREFGRKIFTRSIRTLIMFALYENFPEIRRFIHVLDKDIDDSVMEIVKGIRAYRNFKPSNRHDFVDLLMELEEKGKIKGDSIEHVSPDGTSKQVEMEMTVEIMAAQIFIFFAAGFETSSSATSYTLHQLAINPNIQKKVQSNIDDVLSRYDNKLCYDAIAEMSYLDMAFKEAMRMFPSLGVLNRVCTRKYTIPGTNVIIDPGVNVVIPVQAIQMDEQFFDNPKEFRPERFTPEEMKRRPNYAYLPFGEGPRACIESETKPQYAKANC